MSENKEEEEDLIPLIEFFGSDHHLVGEIISIEDHEEGSRIMLDVEDSSIYRTIYRNIFLEKDRAKVLDLAEGDMVSMSIPAKGGLFVEDCNGTDCAYFTYIEEPYDIKKINKSGGVIVPKSFDPTLN